MKSTTYLLLILFLLISCGVETAKARKKYGPPSEPKIIELENKRIETTYWKHGGKAKRKIYIDGKLYRTSNYNPKLVNMDIPKSIAYWDNGIRLSYSDAGFWIDKTLYDGSMKNVVYTVRVDKNSRRIFINDIELDYKDIKRTAPNELDAHLIER